MGWGTWSDSKYIITNTADSALSAFAIDIDDDGDLDMLSASRYDETIAWYENNGAIES